MRSRRESGGDDSLDEGKEMIIRMINILFAHLMFITCHAIQL